MPECRRSYGRFISGVANCSGVRASFRTFPRPATRSKAGSFRRFGYGTGDRPGRSRTVRCAPGGCLQAPAGSAPCGPSCGSGPSARVPHGPPPCRSTPYQVLALKEELPYIRLWPSGERGWGGCFLLAKVSYAPSSCYPPRPIGRMPPAARSYAAPAMVANEIGPYPPISEPAARGAGAFSWRRGRVPKVSR